MITLIVACEIGFWVFLLAGLLTRYPLRRRPAAHLAAHPADHPGSAPARRGSPADHPRSDPARRSRRIGRRRIGAILLLGAPLLDVVLLASAAIDLRRGGEAAVAHGIAAVYLGVTVAYGHQLMRWADVHFAHRFAGGPPPVRPPRAGRAHAAHERRQWLRHLLAYAVAAALLVAFTPLAGGFEEAAPLWQVMAPWTMVLVIDLVISFSYTVFPRRETTTSSHP